MTTMMFVKFLTFLLCLLSACMPVYAGADGSIKLYPLPLIELEEIINDRFDQLGFEVSSNTLRADEKILIAKRQKEKWFISLKHHSPLATKIKAVFTVAGIPDQSRIDILWNLISTYRNTPSSKDSLIETEISNQVIPTAVLCRIESVVCVKAKGKDRNIQLSGFFVDANGLIICTAHNLITSEAITIVLFDGTSFRGEVLKTNPHLDLALIRVNLESNAFVPLEDGRNLLGMGERLYSIGCPNDLGGTIFSGTINGPPRRLNSLPFWQVNMKIYPGSSGSPVFDIQGNLVAIIKGKYRGTDALGFLIPFETIIEFFKEE